MTDRREFLKAGATVAAAVGLAGGWRAPLGAQPVAGSSAVMPPDASVKELLMEALNAARLAGAGYADVRIQRQRQNFIFTREQQIQNVVDTDSLGCGVRALVDGTWGFAATPKLTKDGVAAAAREAVAMAKANRVARDRHGGARAGARAPERLVEAARSPSTRGTSPSRTRWGCC